MKKWALGIIAGAAAGILDLIPMILQKLTLDANLSAFSMWLIIGLIFPFVQIKITGWLKGIVISFLILLPSAVIIGWKEPFSLIPIGIMTLVLGALLGFSLSKLLKE